MSKKYKEEINKIVMNNDMKKRILQNVLAVNEYDGGVETTTAPKIRKYKNFKRNMEIIVACFAMIFCVSIAKNYPIIFKHTPNELQQSGAGKSDDDEKDEVKSIDDTEFVYSGDSKEIVKDKNKEEQTLDQNNNDDVYVKVNPNASSEIGQEEKKKDDAGISSNSDVKKSQISQNNKDTAMEAPNVSSNINPVEDINNEENKNLKSAKPKATEKDMIPNDTTENDGESGVSVMSASSKEFTGYNQEYNSLEEAEKALDLKINSLKRLNKEYKMESISVISNEIIQIEYSDDTNNIVFKAGKGIDNISGDYNVYQVKDTVKVDEINVSLEGNKSKEYNLAIWEKDGVSYSLSAKNGIDEKTILEMIV